MLTSILPPVVGGPRSGTGRSRWVGLAVVHALATMVSAAAVGGLLTVLASAIGRVGWLSEPWACSLGMLVAAGYLPRQLGWTRLPPLLQSTRQVPRNWAYDYPRWATALLFGLGLGNGCYTRIVVPTFYLLWLWPFLMPGSLWPMLIWCGYGLTRSLHVGWLACTAPLDDLLPHVNRVTVALLGQAAWMHRANGLVLALTVVWLALLGSLR